MLFSYSNSKKTRRSICIFLFGSCFLIFNICALYSNTLRSKDGLRKDLAHLVFLETLPFRNKQNVMKTVTSVDCVLIVLEVTSYSRFHPFGVRIE